MACFEGKCFERPKNEVRRSGSLQKKGSRVKVVPAGDLVMGVYPNAERPSEMENMNALNEGALEKRGYNSAQRDCGCVKDYNLPEPFVDKIFPKPAPPPVFTPEPPPKFEPKPPPPEEFVPIPEPELKDNVPFPPYEPILPIPPNTKKQNPGPTEEGCTGYEWLSTQEARQKCCDELQNVYGGVYEDQMKASELCKNPSYTTETKQNERLPPITFNTYTGTDDDDDDSIVENQPNNTIKVNTKTNSNVRIVETNVGSGNVIDVIQTNGGPSGSFTVGTFQNGNITPVSDPNDGSGGVDEESDIQYEQELVDDGADFSVDIPVGGNDSIGYWTQPSFPPIATVPSNASVPSLSQQGPAAEEAVIVTGGNSKTNSGSNGKVAPSSGMNLGLEQHHGMPQCNSIVRSVTVSRCGDENPYSRGMAIFDSYAGREAAPPGFVVDTDGRRVLKVKSSSGMRTRVVPAGDIPGAPRTGSGFTDAQGRPITSLDQATDTSNKGGSGNETTSRGPTAGAVTASVFNSLGNVAGDAFQYMNNQEANRVRLQIANLTQQRDLQLQAIQSGDLRTRAEAEARLAQINQQGELLRQQIERERLQMQSNQQIADRDMSFRTTALIAGSVLVLGMMGAGIYVATKK